MVKILGSRIYPNWSVSVNETIAIILDIKMKYHTSCFPFWRMLLIPIILVPCCACRIQSYKRLSIMSYSCVLSCYSAMLKMAYFRNMLTITTFESHKIQHNYFMRKLCVINSLKSKKCALFLLKYSISFVHLKIYCITCQQFPKLFEHSPTHEFENHQATMIFNMHILE